MLIPFNKSIQDKYLGGYCMFLAAALHVVFGWDIKYYDSQEVSDDFQTGDHPFIHCWACPDMGKYVDIQGLCAELDVPVQDCLYSELLFWMTWDVQSEYPKFYHNLADAVVLVRDNYDYFASL